MRDPGCRCRARTDADPFRCSQTLEGGSYVDLVVPPGANCLLHGTTVQNKVLVGAGASFTTVNAILSDVDSYKSRSVDIEDSFIAHNLDIRGALEFKLFTTDVGNDVYIAATRGLARIGSADCLLDPSIGGDLTLEENGGATAACNLTIGGTYRADGNFGPISLFTSSIGAGGVHVENNSGPATRVKHLTTTGVLACTDNTSPIFRSNYNQAGQFVGQCAR